MQEVAAANAPSVMALRRASPVGIALLVALVYAGLALAVLAHRPAGDFAFVGRFFVDRSGTSRQIARHAHATSVNGYDGQFALYIALDPTHAATTIDAPAYRYSHILYPALARALALGNDNRVPATLLVVNLLAVFFGTLALGLILRRHRRSPALALLFGFFAGSLIAFDRDLGDLLAYSLVALGVLALHSDTPRRYLIAGAAFGAAALTRETTLLFPAVLSFAELLDRDAPRPARIRRSASLALPAALPYLVWRVFVLSWLGGRDSVPHGLTLFPFGGIAPHGQQAAATFMNVLTVVLPAVIVLVVLVAGGLLRRPTPYAAILALQIVLLVVFLPAQSYADYFALGRLQLGTLVAALCCVPTLMAASLRYRQLLGIAAVLALAPTVVLALVMLGGTPA